jgi:hypothetical protein
MAKFKGIYIMVADRQPTGVGEDFVRDSLQNLVKSDAFFNMLWLQARTEGPKFHEGTQQLTDRNQPFETIVANYKAWLGQEGVAVDEKRWDSYFFHRQVPDPVQPDWTRYALVYYDVGAPKAGSGWLTEYSSLLVDYTLAVRAGDGTKMKQLLGGAVECSECGKIVDPVVRATFKRKGFLTCPHCGQWWTKPATPEPVVESPPKPEPAVEARPKAAEAVQPPPKPVQAAQAPPKPEPAAQSGPEKKWWQFWK